MSWARRATPEERREARVARAHQKVSSWRTRNGVRTVPPGSRLPLLCGVVGCVLPYGHTSQCAIDPGFRGDGR